MSAVVMPLHACELMFYLGGLESTGSLIRMVIKITHGIKGLVAILAIMVVSFAGSYTVLFQSHPTDGFEGFDRTSLTVYGFLFGSYDVPVFDASASPALAKFLVSIFMFFVVIVLLNLLIALMGDIFDEVQSRAESESTFGKAKLIVEYESLFSTAYKKRNEREFYPLWLHVLRKGREDGNQREDSGWKGRTEELRREILEQNRKTVEQNKRMEERIQRIEEQNKRIEDMLNNLTRKLN